MSLLPFLLGLIIGLGLCWWKQYQLNQQLRKLLKTFNSHDEFPTLPTISLVRREISYCYFEIQRLEQELQIKQKILDQAPFGYLLVDEDNQLLWCNQEVQKLLNINRWQPGQVRLLLELIRSYDLDQIIEETRTTQETQIKEWVFYQTRYYPQERDGEMRSLSLRGFSIPLEGGGVAVFLENRQALVELTQSRDRSFSDLLHELKTPLTSIHLVAETLQKRLKPPESAWVERMLQETNRLITLVQDWLDISQLARNPNQNLNYQSIQLQTIILNAWHILEPLAKQKQISLDYPQEINPQFRADPTRLTQVFLNLLDNAIKHSPDQGKILIEVESEPNQISISIIDSGTGFLAKDLPYIFERLYRGETSRTRQGIEVNLSNQERKSHGSGLGLAIVKQIVEAHNGTIQAQNHPETGGAWLKLTLPVS
jgi:two-component system, OmpR family, phosphate regulon sensor histidine kinase PhoR